MPKGDLACCSGAAEGDFWALASLAVRAEYNYFRDYDAAQAMTPSSEDKIAEIARNLLSGSLTGEQTTAQLSRVNPLSLPNDPG